ncbi:hypothetical protein [Nocardia veterana]|uniref:hypothetical protein n=1 Tax=Nocardia veterana TaxID=132249 RepID=UPI001FE0AB23|nr:hypothetical protein [Nocardia veterana]
MITRPGATPARAQVSAHSRRAAVARLRGASAGSVSGALSIAAHGLAAGGMPVPSSTLMLLVAASTVVGALVAGLAPLRTTAVGLVAALWGGQLVGHLVMSADMAHMHDMPLWTPTMLGAHLIAAVCAAVIILGAEAAYRVGTAVARALPVLVSLPVITEPVLPRSPHRDRVILRIFPTETFRTRGPPLTAHC